MSSHCNRYPNCGCNSHVGTKCSLPDGHERLLQKEVERNENGFPLLDNGDIDWELTGEEKQQFLDKYEKKVLPKHNRRNTNLTPKKKKRK